MTDELTLGEYRLLMREDLTSFIERSFLELNPEANFVLNGHIEVMASTLALCRQGELRRLIVNLPPRSLKSHSVSVAFVAWLLGQEPATQIICASYGQELADKHARDCRTLMTSQFYASVFPGTKLSANKQSVNEFMTTRNGVRMSTSVGGVLTGRGADVIILDDPLKPEEAMSDTKRKSVNDWYDNTLLSRLNDKEKGIIIIVMQRLHQDDLVGHVLEQGDWKVLSFPAIAEEDERFPIDTCFGRRWFQRKQGEALHPERESLETLRKIRNTVGEYNFSSQYQQRPIPVGGALVKLSWLQYFDEGTQPKEFDHILQSWDTANKAGELNDFSVCTTWGIYKKKFYLLDVLRRRMEYPALRRALISQYQRFEPNTIVIEDKASGTQLAQDVRTEGLCRIKPYSPPPGADKVLRLYNQTAVFESGRVFLRKDAIWLPAYISELAAFPGSKYDDQIDSTTQALEFMTGILKPTIFDVL